MNIGHIYINGQIGSFWGEKGVELIDVISQAQKFQDAEEINVYINSPGGSIDVGDNIFNYLRSLSQKVRTINYGMVASIATKISFAGEERIMIKGSEYMIHNPWTSGVDGDADQLLKVSEEIRAEEDKLIKFYSDNTGITKEGLDALMKAETFMSAEQALELGFITKVLTEEEAKGQGLILIEHVAPKFKAIAFKKSTKQKTEMSKEIENKLDTLIGFLAKFIPSFGTGTKVALKATDATGATLEITKEDGSEVTTPEAGNLVTIDGAAANGTFALAELSIEIVVVDGVITEVKALGQNANEDLEQAKARIQALETELAERKESDKVIEEKLAMFEDTLKKVSSNYQPGGRQGQTFNKAGQKADEPNRVIAAQERKKSYNQKN